MPVLTSLKQLLESSTPDINDLKSSRRTLSPEERAEVRRYGVPDDSVSRIWKAKVGDVMWYACHNHRIGLVSKTLRKACRNLLDHVEPAD